MDNTPSNPIYVVFFFLLRCIVPLIVMLGISYLLKKLGLISEITKPPAEKENSNQPPDNGNGDYAHV